MNEQAISGILLLDDSSLETLRTSPEDLAEALGLRPIDISALRRADRHVRMDDETIGTMTITASPPMETMNTMTITG